MALKKPGGGICGRTFGCGKFGQLGGMNRFSFQKKGVGQSADKSPKDLNKDGKKCVWYTTHDPSVKVQYESIKDCGYDNLFVEKMGDQSPFRTLKGGVRLWRAQFFRNRAPYNFNPKADPQITPVRKLPDHELKYFYQNSGLWFGTTKNHVEYHNRYPYITSYVVTDEIKLLWIHDLHKILNREDGHGHHFINSGKYTAGKLKGDQELRKGKKTEDSISMIGGYAGCNECEIFIDFDHIAILTFDADKTERMPSGEWTMNAPPLDRLDVVQHAVYNEYGDYYGQNELNTYDHEYDSYFSNNDDGYSRQMVISNGYTRNYQISDMALGIELFACFILFGCLIFVITSCVSFVCGWAFNAFISSSNIRNKRSEDLTDSVESCPL